MNRVRALLSLLTLLALSAAATGSGASFTARLATPASSFSAADDFSGRPPIVITRPSEGAVLTGAVKPRGTGAATDPQAGPLVVRISGGQQPLAPTARIGHDGRWKLRWALHLAAGIYTARAEQRDPEGVVRRSAVRSFTVLAHGYGDSPHSGGSGDDDGQDDGDEG